MTAERNYYLAALKHALELRRLEDEMLLESGAIPAQVEKLRAMTPVKLDENVVTGLIRFLERLEENKP